MKTPRLKLNPGVAIDLYCIHRHDYTCLMSDNPLTAITLVSRITRGCSSKTRYNDYMHGRCIDLSKT